MVRHRLCTGVFAIQLAVLLSCGGETPQEPAKFSELQRDIFTPSCAFSVCHKGAAPAGTLGLDVGSFEHLVNAPSDEAPERLRVTPGNPDASYIMDKLLDRNLPMAPPGEPSWSSMPPTGALEPDRVERIRSWIEAGANND